MAIFGFLCVRKPAGPTSHDVVDMVRRQVPRAAKVGHCGTLDPFADGVLVICLGAATRLASYVQDQPKRYLAQITLGATSTTDDCQGQIAAVADALPPAEPAVRRTIERFIGEIQQTPPAHSAVHVNGVRAYKLARKGAAVPLSPRAVRVDAIELVRYDWPLLEIDVRCGGGTYIRALARDIGQTLAVGGYCSALTRSAVGTFTLDDAVAPQDLAIERDLISPLRAMAGLPRVMLEAERLRRVLMGQAVRVEQPPQPQPAMASTDVAIVDSRERLIAVAAYDAAQGLLRPHIVLAQ